MRLLALPRQLREFKSNPSELGTAGAAIVSSAAQPHRGTAVLLHLKFKFDTEWEAQAAGRLVPPQHHRGTAQLRLVLLQVQV
jgi:hypothetical protein